MSQLREMMVSAMRMRGYADGTRRHYLRAVEKLANYYHRSPDKITQHEIHQYFSHLLDDLKLHPSTVNVDIQALKFFYKVVGQNNAVPEFFLPRTKSPKRLMQILTPEEISAVIEAAPSLKQRALFMVAYGAGLRSSEVVRLKITDILSDRQLLHVQQGKGNKERYTLLSQSLLKTLRSYWMQDHPKEWLFPGQFPGTPMAPCTPTIYFKQVKATLGIPKKGGLHSLRHAFATHLFESGTDLRTIQALMGHRHLSTTAKYMQLSTQHIAAVVSPLEYLKLS